MYTDKVKALLTLTEHKLFQKLSTPQKVQGYLDTLPINFEMRGETYMSPRRVIAAKTAHCFEGALLAAAALAYHGEKPLLMDLRTVAPYEDHVVTLFRSQGLWGAISKTNHAILRYRDPVYRSPRELTMSYLHEYIEENGTRSLREYSAPFDLSRHLPQKWLTAEGDLHWLVEALDRSRHFPLAPKKVLSRLRKASAIELRMLQIVEQRYPKGFAGH
jgi:hypothetical protein